MEDHSYNYIIAQHDSMASYNVFLSSTFADFTEERRRLREIFPYIEVNCICAESAGDTGEKLSKRLNQLIDRCEMVVLLVGSRAGSQTENGDTWTKKEFKYAIKKKKRVFAYIRDLPEQLRALVNPDSGLEKSVQDFKTLIQDKIAFVPRYQLGECCKLTAMVIRDVDRCARELREKEQDDSYDSSFE